MIHKTAIIDATATISEGVVIAPYAIIEANTVIGAGTTIGAHAVIGRNTVLGENNTVFNHASIGQLSQDKKNVGEDTHLTIGDGNTFREFVTIHRGTACSGGITTIGDGNHFLAYSHVAHDCVVGDHAVFSNNATIAGHVMVGDYATLSGFVAVHQFCQIGAYAFIGAQSYIKQDILPYLITDETGRVRGVNKVGLTRHGFSKADIQIIFRAYRTLYGHSRNFGALAEIAASHELLAAWQPFINSKRGLAH